MKWYEKFLEYFATILLILAGVLGILVSILDFVGADFENGPWRWLKGPLPIILLTVATLALALGLERFTRFQQINRQMTRIEGVLEKSVGGDSSRSGHG